MQSATDLGRFIAAAIADVMQTCPDKNQRVLGTDWQDGWNERYRDAQFSGDTGETKLSKLKSGKTEGVQFFFQDRRKGALLLEILRVPEAQRDEILDLGQRLAGDPHQPRVLVDLTAAPDELPKRLLTKVRRWVESLPSELRTVHLLLRDTQRDSLPHSYGDIDGLTVDRLADGATVEAVARRIVAGGGLIVSPTWGLAPLSCWVAFDLDGEAEMLVTAPADAVEQWRQNGRLSEPRAAEYALAGLGFVPDAAESADPGVSGTALHGYIWRVVEGTDPGRPGVRLRDATRLGVTAGASVTEHATWVRQQEDVALERAAVEAGVTVVHAGVAELETALKRARTRPMKAILEAEGQWLWINVSPPDGSWNARVRAEIIEAPVPALDRLWNEVESWTEAQRDADPLLRGVAGMLDPDGREREAFALGRAWLLADRGPPGWPRVAVPEAVPKPHEAVRRLLDVRPVHASLVLEPIDDSRWLSADRVDAWAGPENGLFAVPRPGAARRLPPQQGAVRVTLHVGDFVGGPDVGQGPHAGTWPAMAFVSSATRDFRDADAWLGALETCLGRRPRGEELAVLVATLTDQYGRLWREAVKSHSDGYDWVRGHWNGEFPAAKHLAPLDLGSRLPDPRRPPDFAALARVNAWRALCQGLRTTAPLHERTDVPVAPDVWPTLERRIAQLKIALRTALDAGLSQETPDGALLVSTGSGIDALVRVTSGHGDERWEGAAATVDAKTARIELEATLHVHTVEGAETLKFSGGQGPTWASVARHIHLPGGVFLCADGVLAEIRFVENPLTIHR